MHPKLIAMIGDEAVPEREAARILGVPLIELQRWRREGRGPAHMRLARKCTIYKLGDIQKWLASRYVEPSKSHEVPAEQAA
jgi:Helix-turn-helix domain